MKTDPRPLGSGYLLDEPIGHGAMGQVWRATVRETGELRAVKVLRSELADEAEIVARFVQERSILTALRGDHLVRVHDLVVEGQTLAIVMDLIPGPDLRAYLSRSGVLDPAIAFELVAQICDGLASAHAANVVHRDLKPENVLLEEGGSVPLARLSDFGIARITEGPALTRTTGLIGTPEYMAPEVAESSNASAASDLYAAGIVLYELLTGRTPFAGGHPVAILRRHMEDAPAPIPGLSDDSWAILAELLTKDPADRPQDAGAVAARLRKVDPGSGVQGAPPAPQGNVFSPVSPYPAAAGARTAVDNATRLGFDPKVFAPAEPEVPVVAARRRPDRRLLGVVGGVVVVALVAAGLLLRGGGSAAIDATPVRLRFDPIAVTKDVQVQRSWTLSDALTLRGVVEIINDGSTAITDGRWEEVLPPSVTSDIASVVFTPAPSAVDAATGTATWTVTLQPGQRFVVRYVARVAAGAVSTDRLRKLATAQLDAEEAVKASRVDAVSLAKLVVRPDPLSLTVGQVMQVTAIGALGNGQLAGAPALARLAWTSDNPSVAVVDAGGRVSAVGPGTASVRAEVGKLTASVAVTVAAPVTIAPVPTTAAPPIGKPRSTKPRTVVPKPSAPTPTTSRPVQVNPRPTTTQAPTIHTIPTIPT